MRLAKMTENDVAKILAPPCDVERQEKDRMAVRKEIDGHRYRVVYKDEGQRRVIITAFEEE